MGLRGPQLGLRGLARLAGSARGMGQASAARLRCELGRAKQKGRGRAPWADGRGRGGTGLAGGGEELGQEDREVGQLSKKGKLIFPFRI